jgi:transposase-like protein
MDPATLASQLAKGKSIESIARDAGRPASTVAYWVNKHGLTSSHAGPARRARRDRPRTASSARRGRPLDPGDGG